MSKTISQIAALLGIIAMAFGAYLFLDTTFAKCAEQKALERRLDYDIESNRLYRMRDQKREFYRDFPDTTKAPMAVQRQMNELDQDLDMQREKVKKLEGK